MFAKTIVRLVRATVISSRRAWRSWLYRDRVRVRDRVRIRVRVRFSLALLLVGHVHKLAAEARERPVCALRAEPAYLREAVGHVVAHRPAALRGHRC